jgi:thioredoxin 2
MSTPAVSHVHVACPNCLAQNRVDGARLAEGPKCGRCEAPLLDASVVELDDAS